ncbi:MAG: hypothetical protein KC933_06750 [Myxococcales bacterium]|nr:hypothetical protein [Myxococcales bacterium]
MGRGARGGVPRRRPGRVGSGEVLEHQLREQVVLRLERGQRRLVYRPRLDLLAETRARARDLPPPARAVTLLLVARELYRTPYFFDPTEPDALHQAAKADLMETLGALGPLVRHAPERIRAELPEFRIARHSNLAYPDDFMSEADGLVEQLRRAAEGVVP